jgi:ferrous iron transport protein B
LPIFAVLIGAFFGHHKAQMMFLLTLLSWAFALLAAKVIRSTVLRGPKTPFVMELPPYRIPTLRGLFIHSWERTWQYVKKAGTVILGFSILLWAMMTYPGLPDEKRRVFDQRRMTLTNDFLSEPEIKDWVNDGESLMELNGLYEAYGRAVRRHDAKALKTIEKSPLIGIVEAARQVETGAAPTRSVDSAAINVAGHYLNFREEMTGLDMLEQEANLKRTVAGWIGHQLEVLTRPLGFDYRVNMALLGGFAAKEIVVSTLGTAYSLGEVDPDEGGSLSQRLKNDPKWNPLVAFTLLVFVMLYVPCFVTVISIRKESSWAWAGFSVVFNLLVAYGVAFAVSQLGRLFLKTPF